MTDDETFEALWKLADFLGYDLTRREGADDPDYGTRDDLTSGNVWPDVTAMLDEMESQTDLADRAIQAALDASPKPHYDYRVAKHQSRGADFGMFGRDYGG